MGDETSPRRKRKRDGSQQDQSVISRIRDEEDAALVESQTNEPPSTTPTTRITSEAKQALFDFFERLKWPLNKKMPRKNGNPGLDAIIKKFDLKRSQASNQLSSWKKKRFVHNQPDLINMSAEAIKQILKDYLSVSTEEFVENLLRSIINGEEYDGTSNTTKYIQSLRGQLYSEIKFEALQFILENKEHVCFVSLKDYVEDLLTIASEEMPSRASKLSSSEMEFTRRYEAAKKERIAKWKRVYNDMPGDEKLSAANFARFGMFVANCLFFVWTDTVVRLELPKIEIPRENLVAKYSMPVVYYVAGWTLQRASLALTVARDDRAKYSRFASNHKRCVEYAKKENLPYTLVQLREKKNLFYVTKDYFDFICLLESIYVKNLTLQMMWAYKGGELVHAINTEILKSEDVISRFSALVGGDDQSEDVVEQDGRLSDDHFDILKFITDRYVRMRGCWFVKSLRADQNETLGDKKVASMATNLKVSVLCSKTKAIGEALRKANAEVEVTESEQDQWEQAAAASWKFDDNEEDKEAEDDSDGIGEDEMDGYDGEQL